jgi:hypothetical protein
MTINFNIYKLDYFKTNTTNIIFKIYKYEPELIENSIDLNSLSIKLNYLKFCLRNCSSRNRNIISQSNLEIISGKEFASKLKFYCQKGEYQLI